jgi:hypothetical protein
MEVQPGRPRSDGLPSSSLNLLLSTWQNRNLCVQS